MIEHDVMSVSGKVVKLRPYTEKRFKDLMAVTEEIDKYIAENPEVTFADIDPDLKASWWKRKGDILWYCDEPLGMDFYRSENFESSQLRKAQDFFLHNGLFL